MKLLKKLFFMELTVEIQTCMNFLCVLCFYCFVQLFHGINEANIWIMLQMLLVAYVCQYIYIFFGNIEDSGHLGIKELMIQLLIYSIYAVVSYFGKWFEQNFTIMGIFILYLVFQYLLVSWVFYIKRKNDTKNLNNLLEDYKRKRGNQE